VKLQRQFVPLLSSHPAEEVFVRTILCFGFSFMLGASIVLAAPQETKGQGKPSWEWTLEERLAARFNPEAIKAWAAEERARIVATGVEVEDDYPNELAVDGSRNPELLLPHEIFSHLINMCFPPDGMDQEYSRSLIESRAAAFGFGSSLWERLEKNIRPLLAYDRERHERAMAVINAGLKFKEEERGPVRCRLMAAALAAVRRDFGEPLFQQFLYQVVAPTTSRSYSPTEDLESFLRFQEGGCK
jgi:hypothetical protein